MIAKVFQILLLIFPFLVFSQQNNFSGKVIDSLGNPVEKAEICRIRSSNCVQSDLWGKYNIPLTDKDFIRIT